MNLTSIPLNPRRLSPINPYNLYGVTWLALIDQIIIDHKIDIDGSLSLWDLIGSLLELNVLLISISGEIIHHLKGVSTAACVASLGLIDPSSLESPQLALLTSSSRASKEDLLGLRDDLGASNEDPLETDQSVNLSSGQVSHLMGLLKVDYPDPNDLIE